MSIVSSIISAAPIPGGGIIGGVIDSVSSLLTNSRDKNNNQFLSNMVTFATNLGFVGFNTNDVIHLMPGGWGSDYQTAAYDFNSYLMDWKKNYPAGTNLALPQNDPGHTGQNVWGGGYVPNHVIYYKAPIAINYSNNSTPPGPNSNPNNTSSFNLSWLLIIGLIGAAVYFLMKG